MSHQQSSSRRGPGPLAGPPLGQQPWVPGTRPIASANAFAMQESLQDKPKERRVPAPLNLENAMDSSARQRSVTIKKPALGTHRRRPVSQAGAFEQSSPAETYDDSFSVSGGDSSPERTPRASRLNTAAVDRDLYAQTLQEFARDDDDDSVEPFPELSTPKRTPRKHLQWTDLSDPSQQRQRQRRAESPLRSHGSKPQSEYARASSPPSLKARLRALSPTKRSLRTLSPLKHSSKKSLAPVQASAPLNSSGQHGRRRRMAIPQRSSDPLPRANSFSAARPAVLPTDPADVADDSYLDMVLPPVADTLGSVSTAGSKSRAYVGQAIGSLSGLDRRSLDQVIAMEKEKRARAAARADQEPPTPQEQVGGQEDNDHHDGGNDPFVGSSSQSRPHNPARRQAPIPAESEGRGRAAREQASVLERPPLGRRPTQTDYEDVHPRTDPRPMETVPFVPARAMPPSPRKAAMLGQLDHRDQTPRKQGHYDEAPSQSARSTPTCKMPKKAARVLGASSSPAEMEGSEDGTRDAGLRISLDKHLPELPGGASEHHSVSSRSSQPGFAVASPQQLCGGGFLPRTTFAGALPTDAELMPSPLRTHDARDMRRSASSSPNEGVRVVLMREQPGEVVDRMDQLLERLAMLEGTTEDVKKLSRQVLAGVLSLHRDYRALARGFSSLSEYVVAHEERLTMAAGGQGPPRR